MFDDVIQHVLNGLVMGAVVALPALGLTLVFSVLGFVNFSIAALMTVGRMRDGWSTATCIGRWCLRWRCLSQPPA